MRPTCIACYYPNGLPWEKEIRNKISSFKSIRSKVRYYQQQAKCSGFLISYDMAKEHLLKHEIIDIIPECSQNNMIVVNKYKINDLFTFYDALFNSLYELLADETVKNLDKMIVRLDQVKFIISDFFTVHEFDQIFEDFRTLNYIITNLELENNLLEIIKLTNKIYQALRFKLYP